MKIDKFDYLISSDDFDIVHRERRDSNEDIVKSSILNLVVKGEKIRIKFELIEDNEINNDDFLYVPETYILFYRGIIEWCAFDLSTKSIVRNEKATQLPFIERRNDVILIYDELYAESTDLKAKRIDNVLIDPPTESVYYDDRIEFDSPVFGKQILKLNRDKIL